MCLVSGNQLNAIAGMRVCLNTGFGNVRKAAEHVAPRLKAFAVRLVLLSAVCLLTSCFGLSRFPKLDASGPGWTVQQGEVLWKPGKKYPELAGEVVLASNIDGRSFVQFTKTTFPMAAAQITTTNWAIAFPPQKLAFRGSGDPPSRFGWLELLRALHSQNVPQPWQFARKADGSWRLANPRSGESLEGFLNP